MRKYTLALATAALTLLAAPAPAQTVRIKPSRLVTIDRQTPLVAAGQTTMVDMAFDLPQIVVTSLAVYSGCDSYDFALYDRDTAKPGSELLYVSGQLYNYFDGAPPNLRDADNTSELHARFVNRGLVGCTFRVVVKGTGAGI